MEKALFLILYAITSSKPKELYSNTVPLILHDDYVEVVNIDTTEISNYEVEDIIISESEVEIDEEINVDTEVEIDEVIEVDEDDNSSFITQEIIEDEVISNTDTNDTTIEIALVEEVSNNETEIKEEISGYYSPNGTYLGEHNIKVVDVSAYQKDVNWDAFANESDCYGVILRLGYYDTLDKKFERNINELKRLNIPYGIYLYSYAIDKEEAIIEANFTMSMIDKYDIEPTLGIYYDIESWNRNDKKSSSISKDMYDIIIGTYIDLVSNYVNNTYKVKVYSGRWYAMNKFNLYAKSYVDWVAEYNKTCNYDDSYSMWQYTSKGSVPGIEGNVDISYIL